MEKVVAHYPSKQAPITRTLGMLLALLFVIMAVLQLFSFEHMPEAVTKFWSPMSSEIGLIIAALIVVAEVFALPFLLGMQLSALMRIVSLLLTLSAVIYWSIVALIGMTRTVTLTGIGIANPYAMFPNGAWFMLLMTGVMIMLLWYLIDSYRDAHKLHHHLRNSHK